MAKITPMSTRGGGRGGSAVSPLVGQIASMYDDIAAQFQPGGSYTKGIEAQLARRKKGAMASGMQSLVSSGMAGTTQAAGLGSKFEEEVGMPTMAAAETSRIGKLTEAMMGKAGFMASQIPQQMTAQPQSHEGEVGYGGPSLMDQYKDKFSSFQAGNRSQTTKASGPRFRTHTGRSMFSPIGSSKKSTSAAPQYNFLDIGKNLLRSKIF